MNNWIDMIEKLKRKLIFWLLDLADNLRLKYGIASKPQIVYRESKAINLRTVKIITPEIMYRDLNSSPLDMVREAINYELTKSAEKFIVHKVVNRYDGQIEVHGLLTLYQRED